MQITFINEWYKGYICDTEVTYRMEVTAERENKTEPSASDAENAIQRNA